MKRKPYWKPNKSPNNLNKEVSGEVGNQSLPLWKYRKLLLLQKEGGRKLLLGGKRRILLLR
jgi:hypothetical protein